MAKLLAKSFVYDKTILEDLFEVLDMLFDKMQLDKDGYPVNFGYAEFYVVNCCLFCELCFKAFALKDGIDVEKEHNLLNLFSQLPDDKQYQIASNTMATFGPSTDYLLEFRNFLEKEKENFVVFRYLIFSESEGYTCCSFLRNLSLVLKSML